MKLGEPHPEQGVRLSCPLICDKLPPVTRLITLVMPLVEVVKLADSPGLMVKVWKLWNRLLPESLPIDCGMVMLPESVLGRMTKTGIRGDPGVGAIGKTCNQHGYN